MVKIGAEKELHFVVRCRGKESAIWQRRSVGWAWNADSILLSDLSLGDALLKCVGEAQRVTVSPRELEIEYTIIVRDGSNSAPSVKCNSVRVIGDHLLWYSAVSTLVSAAIQEASNCLK